ncbi:unknown [Clostridium sp. CAG:964]|nr:unknown [Clostridium sp. CAG:964]
MGWGFAESLAFAAVMTLRDMSNEKSNRLIKTQRFYQECYERIADDSHQAFNVVSKVVQKASRRYILNEIGSGSTYLALYAFALVIERQGRVTSEQSKIIKMYFDNMRFPFSQSAYLSAAKTGSEIGDFRKVISISRDYAGGFWVNFFRALYKSGTQKDLQDVIDCTTSMIMRFSILGNPNSNLAPSICTDFVESVNYQINQVREISIKEIDWLGVIPIPERLEEMKIFYESLIDNSNITDDISKDELLLLLELLILNCICDVVMMTKQPKSVKLQMMNDAAALSGIQTDVTPEQYVKEIANNTETGAFYKAMFSSGSPLGSIWSVILTMGGQTNRTDEAIAITNDMLSILLQIENYLDEKYNFLGAESLAKNYMLHIIQQLANMCE